MSRNPFLWMLLAAFILAALIVVGSLVGKALGVLGEEEQDSE